MGAIARKVGISENTVKSFCRRNAQKEDKPVTGAGEHRCLCCGAPVAQQAGRKKRSSALTSAETSGGMPISIKLTAGRSGRSSVQTAAGPFRFTGAPRESTAAMPATSSIGLEVAAVSKEQLTNEKLYQATMSMVRRMLEKGLISEEEYRQIDTMFLEKYRPVFGTLFSEIR